MSAKVAKKQTAATKQSSKKRRPKKKKSAKGESYTLLVAQLRSLLKDEYDFIANTANFSSLVYNALPDVNWAGFYLLQDHELVLGPFQGKPACVRIPLGKGVCGFAAKQCETVIVPNVSEFPGHIACDPTSKSEIVIPFFKNGKVAGVLDVDSDKLSDFDKTDADFLKQVTAQIEKFI